MLCDLHIHSIYSDGSHTPSEVIDLALDAGLSAIALTDHNTIDGLTDFISAANGKNIDIVLGAEFSANYKGKELHILGLFISPEHFDDVSNLMDKVTKRKEESNIALIDSLNAAGFDLSYDEIKNRTPNGKFNRAHVATVLFEKGYIGSIQEGFKTILSKSAGHYAPPKLLSANEIINFINSIGAVAVLAHPFLSLNEQELIEFIESQNGLVGMECYYSTYDKETTEKSIRIAKEFNLICSGGSDFHGLAKPDIKIGVGKGNLKIPYECYLDVKKHAK